MEVETCKHCGGKLIVYTSRLKKSHRVQYLRCKQCGRPASKKQIQHDMLERLSTLEGRVDSVEKSIESVLDSVLASTRG
jgi:transcription elongation factor Elf1